MKTIDDGADGRVVFAVRVQPRASRSEVIGWTASGELKVRVTAPPVDDSANDQLIRLLSKTLSVPKSQIAFVSGATSRSKRLSAPADARAALLELPEL